MAFIERKNPVVLNIKLTSKGRELLSEGELDFKYYAIGDSEIDYEFNKKIIANPNVSEYTTSNSSILRAADKNADLISFIPKNLSGDPYSELTNVPSTVYSVENQVESLGFFTDNNTKFITDSNHVKQPDAYIDMETVSGSPHTTLYKNELTYGTSGEEPAVGDILFVQFSPTTNTTGSTFTLNKDYPQPNLFYKITAVGTGTLASGSVNISVDRNLPDFRNILNPDVHARAMIYYNEISFSGDTILSISPTDYLDESVLNFLENSQCPTIVFPYWNMSIIFTEEIAGVLAGNLKYTQFKSRTFGGFISYIQNQAPTLKKLGVIHYTNSSPANVYGEGFLQDTPTVDIPTIMWHKSPTKTLGITLSPIGGQQLLADLNLYYYELADSEEFVVGKMFPDLKIFVIEDQELLFAMSYKSNRSWTLPDYTANTGAINSEYTTSGNTVFISYILIPAQPTGQTYSQAIHCNYVKKINLGQVDPYIQEVSLNFPNIDYFKFLTSEPFIMGSDGTGYTASKIHALVQIVSNTSFDTFDDVTPDSTQWKQLDITPQVTGYTATTSFLLTPANLTSVVFKISLLQYAVFSSYDLSYLDYPGDTEEDKLIFGDVTYFFGNVATDIKAEVYTTDIDINLSLNEFNSSTNLTWDGIETVYISEIGIYDNNTPKNLVAIGKLNDPVAKDSRIARTIVFALDF